MQITLGKLTIFEILIGVFPYIQQKSQSFKISFNT